MPRPERSYTDLIVWQKSLDLSVAIYQLTDKFPKSEQFGLINQMRRAAVSVPSNIAEGRSRRTSRDFMNFLRMALGSVAELDTQLIIAEEIRYAAPEEFTKCKTNLIEVRKMLHGMIKKLGTSA